MYEVRLPIDIWHLSQNKQIILMFCAKENVLHCVVFSAILNTQPLKKYTDITKAVTILMNFFNEYSLIGCSAVCKCQ